MRSYHIGSEIMSRSAQTLFGSSRNLFDTVLATVSPSNQYSLDNFLEKGFTVSQSGLSKYGGLDRSLLAYRLS